MAFAVGFEAVAAGLRVVIHPCAGTRPYASKLGALKLDVVLDHLHLGEVVAKPNRKRTCLEADIALPGAIFGGSLDLLDAATGLSILPQPYTLDSYYGFEPGVVTVADGRLRGEFSVSRLDQRVLIEFCDEHRLMARGFATHGGAERSRYSFNLPLLSTLKPGDSVFLVARIAGRTVPGAGLRVTAADAGFIGFVDVVQAGLVKGWAMHLGKPGEPVAVDLIIDGEVADTVTANQPREDLRAAGLGDGRLAFTFTMRATAQFQVPKIVSVVISGTPMELQGSPTEAPPPPAIRGAFEQLQGMAAYGWAINDLDPQTPVAVEAVCQGHVLAAGTAKLFRSDLQAEGMNGGCCGFKIEIGAGLLKLLGKPVVVRVASTGAVLSGSPLFSTQNPNRLRYLRPNRGVRPQTLPRLRRALNHRAGPSVVTIVMQLRDTPRQWLIESLNSVLAQWCDHWQLICVHDGPAAPPLAEMLRAFTQKDRRIRAFGLDGTAGTVDMALHAANGAYATFMEPGDTLEPDAVYHLLRSATVTGADLVYSDEATTDESITGIGEVQARPAFSYDYYLSQPYFVHMLCVRRELACQVGWQGPAIAAGMTDFVLRLLETAPLVAHVPRVLYRWRNQAAAIPQATEPTRAAIQRHLDRRRTGAAAEVCDIGYRLTWPATNGRMLIVIPARGQAGPRRATIAAIERQLASAAYRIVVIDHAADAGGEEASFAPAGGHAVMRYDGPSNTARMNNLAVAAHATGCDFVLFLDEDMTPLSDGCLDRMRRLANREDVGGVGALLLDPDRRVQHAGLMLGAGGNVVAPFRFADAFEPGGARNRGYNGSLTAVRDWSAVTGSCLMMRTRVFKAIGGFDERLPLGLYDVDLCLRLRQAGYKVLYDGGSVLQRQGSVTDNQAEGTQHASEKQRLLDRHPSLLASGDPFYNPNLADVAQDHTLREDAGCKHFQVRVTPFEAPRTMLPADEPVARPKRRRVAAESAR